MSSSTSGQMTKPQRAQFAKETINKVIPHILKHNPRALASVSLTELISYTPLPKPVPKPTSAANPIDLTTSPVEATKLKGPKISVAKSDTYVAAHSLFKTYPRGTKIAILNMASIYQPGGGVLKGAIAQEESLCIRSTLYPSLDTDSTFYPLAENHALYSPSVLVFRSESNEDLKKEDWWNVNVISIAAVKNPDLTKEGRYAEDRDREAMRMKIKLIFQTARTKGCKVLVLGALGCGAYGNPVEEVAELFRRCMEREEVVEGIEEVVFAIFDEGRNLRVFREVLTGK